MEKYLHCKNPDVQKILYLLNWSFDEKCNCQWQFRKNVDLVQKWFISVHV